MSSNNFSFSTVNNKQLINKQDMIISSVKPSTSISSSSCSSSPTCCVTKNSRFIINNQHSLVNTTIPVNGRNFFIPSNSQKQLTSVPMEYDVRRTATINAKSGLNLVSNKAFVKSVDYHPKLNTVRPNNVICNGIQVLPDNNSCKANQQLSIVNGVNNKSTDYTITVDRTTLPMNGSLVKRRIMILFENLQYDELAKFIEKINSNIYGEVLSNLQINDFINGLPSTIHIMESFYRKFEECKKEATTTTATTTTTITTSTTTSSNSQLDIIHLNPNKMILHLMELFALQSINSPDKLSNNSSSNVNNSHLKIRQEFTNHILISMAKNILKVIMMYQASAKKQLLARKMGIDKAIEGLGLHGLVGTNDDSLLELSDALKIELNQGIVNLKSGLSKTEDLIVNNSKKQPIIKSVTRGPAPVQTSHQRQLSIKQDELNERLARNTALFTAIEPCCQTGRALQNLLDIVDQRINYDKEVLLQYNELKRLFNVSSSSSLNRVKDVWKTFDSNTMIAPILMRFSAGCAKVLTLLDEVCQENNIKESSNTDDSNCNLEEDADRTSDISGYHSGSDCHNRKNNNPAANLGNKISDTTKVITSKNDQTDKPKNESEIGGQKSNDLLATKDTPRDRSNIKIKGSIWMDKIDENEIARLRHELSIARQTINQLEEHEKRMREKLSEQAQTMMNKGILLPNSGLNDYRPAALIRKYGNLYAQARVDTLDALDSLPQLKDADDLKAKLLFSLVVLSFCSVQKVLENKKHQIRKILNVPENSNDQALQMAIKQIDRSVHACLKLYSSSFDLRKCSEEVLSQICATLYDYPCLKQCDGLLHYIKDCVSLAWSLSVQNPPFIIEYESKNYDPKMHIRFHTSNQDSNLVQCYLWPSLVELTTGRCVHKGVIIT